jgi:hypothetical protein
MSCTKCHKIRQPTDKESWFMLNEREYCNSCHKELLKIIDPFEEKIRTIMKNEPFINKITEIDHWYVCVLDGEKGYDHARNDSTAYVSRDVCAVYKDDSNDYYILPLFPSEFSNYCCTTVKEKEVQRLKLSVKKFWDFDQIIPNVFPLPTSK